MRFERSRSRRAYRLNADDEAFLGRYEHDPLGGGFDEPYGELGEFCGDIDGSYGEREGSSGARDEFSGDRQDGYSAQNEPAGEAGAPSRVLPRDGRRSVVVRRRAGVAVVALVAMAFSALVVHALRAGLAGSQPAGLASGSSLAMPRTAPIAAGNATDAPALARRVGRRLAAGTASGMARVAHRVSRRQSPPRAQDASAAAVAVQAAPAVVGGTPQNGPSRTPEFGFER